MATSQNRQLSLSRIIGLMGVLAIIVGVIWLGGGGLMFIHIPSLVFTLGITFFLLLGIFGSDFLKFIPDALITLVSRSTEPNERFAQIAISGSRYVIGAGLIGALIGMIQMLRNLTSPKQIGAGMAVALLTALYAVITSEIFFAFLHKAYCDGAGCKSQSDSSKNAGLLPLKNVALPGVVVLFMIVSFLVLLISLSEFS